MKRSAIVTALLVSAGLVAIATVPASKKDRAEASTAAVFLNDLAGNEHNRQSDRCFDGRAGNMDQAQRRKCQCERVRECKGRHGPEEAPMAANQQDKCQHEA